MLAPRVRPMRAMAIDSVLAFIGCLWAGLGVEQAALLQEVAVPVGEGRGAARQVLRIPVDLEGQGLRLPLPFDPIRLTIV